MKNLHNIQPTITEELQALLWDFTLGTFKGYNLVFKNGQYGYIGSNLITFGNFYPLLNEGKSFRKHCIERWRANNRPAPDYTKIEYL